MASSAKSSVDDDVVTLPEAAAWLRVSERTLAGRLDDYPHFRVGKQIRFLKSELRRAAKQRSQRNV